MSHPTHHLEQRNSRELAARETDGRHVQLLWNPIADAVTVAVKDLRAGERFHLAVARERALDAFYHPRLRRLTSPPRTAERS